METELKHYTVRKYDNGKNTFGCCSADSALTRIGLQASDFHSGTIIKITCIEPTLKVVLPEGMQWGHYNGVYFLFTKDGAIIAKVENYYATYWKPFEFDQWKRTRQESNGAARDWIENELAEHDYYGVKKVVVE
jgi:hypothetical protein